VTNAHIKSKIHTHNKALMHFLCQRQYVLVVLLNPLTNPMISYHRPMAFAKTVKVNTKTDSVSRTARLKMKHSQMPPKF